METKFSLALLTSPLPHLLRSCSNFAQFFLCDATLMNVTLTNSSDFKMGGGGVSERHRHGQRVGATLLLLLPLLPLHLKEDAQRTRLACPRLSSPTI